MKLKKLFAILSLSFLAMSVDGCGDGGTDEAQTNALEKMAAEAHRQVGLPLLTNFTQLKLAKWIQELCDTEGLSTFTYIVNMHGEMRFLTESIGYGLPFSTQFVNPERCCEHTQGGDHAIAQPEPNGLFMPSSSSATWVIAVTEEGPQPMYVESEITVTTFMIEGVPNAWDVRK